MYIETEQMTSERRAKNIMLLTVVFVLADLIAVCGICAQPSKTENAATPDRVLRFAVVSIRQNKSGGPQIFGKTTPDGYEMRNMFLAAAVLSAYVPRTGGANIYSDEQVIGMPPWLVNDEERYDLDAKVEEADLPDWQNPAKQPAMLQAMLQTMLADRLKLKVHRDTKETIVYALLVGKGGPHFKETVPGETHSGAYPMPGGGMLSMDRANGSTTTHYFGISISQLISMVLPESGRTIQDRTGLMGRYDVTITKEIPAGIGTAGASASPDISTPEIASQLGLKLERSEGQVETLVIDHVQRPSPN